MRKRIVKNIFYSIIFSLCWPIVVTAQVNQAVTYFLNRGRLGDKIIYYTTAKWISHKFNIPLFIKPFQYSSMLRFGVEEKKYSKGIARQFKKVIPVCREQDVIRYKKANVLFESKGVYFRTPRCAGLEQTIGYMLQDQYFAAELRNMLQPVVPLPQITLPEDKVAVAVHIRKGGEGFDLPLNSIQYYTKLSKFADERWPLKFPPEQYYVDQIKRISTLLDDAPLFMYIFTDDRNPGKLINRIKREVGKDNITFACRSSGNMHNRYVIEDFYNMSCFDCLIRSGSHFAVAAQLLGNHKIIIYPKHWKWIGRKLIIDEISIVDNRAS